MAWFLAGLSQAFASGIVFWQNCSNDSQMMLFARVKTSYRSGISESATIARMTTLGLISDTHGRLDDGVWDAFAHVDYIIHAGDIGNPFLLDELRAIAPVFACLGNNDWDDYGPSVGAYKTAHLDGCHILIAHFPRDVERYIREKKYQLLVHGHTHIPRDEMKNGCRIVNPGSASRPRGGSKKSVMLLEVSEGEVGPSRLIELDSQCAL